VSLPFQPHFPIVRTTDFRDFGIILIVKAFRIFIYCF
jgi:hypothetical protein